MKAMNSRLQPMLGSRGGVAQFAEALDESGIVDAA